MIPVRRISIIATLILLSQGILAQGNFRLPTLNDVRNGHLKSLKVPKLNDYKKFIKGYEKQLAILDRRNEKAYKKSFLKFIELEDKLLYTLCDSNEFRANALMRSAAASYGKMENDRNNKPGIRQNAKLETLSNAVELSENNISGLNAENTKQAESQHEKSQNKFSSNFYSEYMKKRVDLYDVTFKNGTKKQKKLFRKLRTRALLWQSYKEQDAKMLNDFADNHLGIMRSFESRPELASAMNPKMADYSGTHIDPNLDASGLGQSNLMGMLQEKLTADGLLTSEQLADVESIKDLFSKVQELKEAVPDSTAQKDENIDGKKTKKEKPLKMNSKSSKRFWDRLYGGADFDWENSTGYYPDGLGITLNGGYSISDNSGLTLEFQSVLNASKMGWKEDLRFKSTLVSNYTIGANVDYRIWKVFFAGVGSELIIDNIEAPAEKLYDRLQNTKYTYGIPLILRVLLPVNGLSSTNIEFRYDLNSKNNIKPKFDFKVGFLIGR